MTRAERPRPRAPDRAASQGDRPDARSASSGCSPRSAIRSGGCRRWSTSPAPTARARWWRCCAPGWRPPARGSTSTPRRTSPASTSASASPASSISEDRLIADARALRGGERRRADHLLRDHHRRRLPGDGRDAGGLRPARGRPRRPARRHQRHRPAAADRHHPGLARPPAVPRRDAGRDRRREGRDPEARHRLHRRPAGAGGAGGDRGPRRADAGAADGRGPGLAGLGGARPDRLPGRQRPPRPAAAEPHRRAPGG